MVGLLPDDPAEMAAQAGRWRRLADLAAEQIGETSRRLAADYEQREKALASEAPKRVMRLGRTSDSPG